MTRSTPILLSRPSCRGPNLIAILISFSAVSFLYFNFDPTPVGADSSLDEQGSVSALKSILQTPPPPSLPKTVMGTVEDTEPNTVLGTVEGTEQPTASASNAAQQKSNSVTIGDRDQTVLNGRMALLMHLLMLEKANARLEKIDNYTATFCKQERVDGQLSDLQIMEIKLRHSPFSIYMKWIDGGDVGRELLFVDGKNDGKMLVHVGGFKGRFLPSLSLHPQGTLAMEESRYPITKAGMLALIQMAISYRQHDLALANGVTCQMISDHKFDDRNCYCFIVEYNTPKISEIYRKSITYFDKTLSVPVFIKNYTWPHRIGDCDENNLDESTVIEHYAFSNINLEKRLADADFDRMNSSYRLRR